MISSLSSAIEHSDPTQTLHPQVIQEYLVCLPQLQQEESKVFLHSAMIEALDKTTLAFCGQKYSIGAGVSRDLTDAKTMASFASHHLLLLYQEYKF